MQHMVETCVQHQVHAAVSVIFACLLLQYDFFRSFSSCKDRYETFGSAHLLCGSCSYFAMMDLWLALLPYRMIVLFFVQNKLGKA